MSERLRVNWRRRPFLCICINVFIFPVFDLISVEEMEPVFFVLFLTIGPCVKTMYWGFQRQFYQGHTYLPILFLFKSAFFQSHFIWDPWFSRRPRAPLLDPSQPRGAIDADASLEETFHQMKGKENGLDNVLHAVLLIYFHCFISRKIFFFFFW